MDTADKFRRLRYVYTLYGCCLAEGSQRRRRCHSVSHYSRHRRAWVDSRWLLLTRPDIWLSPWSPSYSSDHSRGNPYHRCLCDRWRDGTRLIRHRLALCAKSSLVGLGSLLSDQRNPHPLFHGPLWDGTEQRICRTLRAPGYQQRNRLGGLAPRSFVDWDE